MCGFRLCAQFEFFLLAESDKILLGGAKIPNSLIDSQMLRESVFSRDSGSVSFTFSPSPSHYSILVKFFQTTNYSTLSESPPTTLLRHGQVEVYLPTILIQSNFSEIVVFLGKIDLNGFNRLS